MTIEPNAKESGRISRVNVCAVIALVVLPSVVFADTLRVGVAQQKITPKMGSYLGGYWRVRIAESVKSDLYSKAMVFEFNGRRVAIVANDLIGITPEIAAAAKEIITKKCSIRSDAILICATHTFHSFGNNSGKALVYFILLSLYP